MAEQMNDRERDIDRLVATLTLEINTLLHYMRCDIESKLTAFKAEITVADVGPICNMHSLTSDLRDAITDEGKKSSTFTESDFVFTEGEIDDIEIDGSLSIPTLD